ncbi:MAG: flavodoxin [Lachnospiraceae bacterium]|nr:flavodoxin [Lachnospiraceae bacterium]
MKTLVTFFSVSSKTKKVAERLAKLSGADLFEIKPEVPYTSADVKFINPLARCNKEKLGKAQVPIADKISNFDEYDLIVIGFPIWYAAEPNIIDTFVTDYDFSGKKVALFATSGGTGAAKSKDKVQAVIKGDAKVIDSKLFKVDSPDEDLKNWIEKL